MHRSPCPVLRDWISLYRRDWADPLNDENTSEEVFDELICLESILPRWAGKSLKELRS